MTSHRNYSGSKRNFEVLSVPLLSEVHLVAVAARRPVLPLTFPCLGLLATTFMCTILLRRTLRPILLHQGKNARLPAPGCLCRHPWPVSSCLWTLGAEQGLGCRMPRPDRPLGSLQMTVKEAEGALPSHRPRLLQGSRKRSQTPPPRCENILQRLGVGVGWGRGPAQDSASEDRHAGSKRKSRSFLEEEAEAKTAGS